MKNKLRKIVINGSVYYYRFTYMYYESHDKCKSTFKVFKDGFKNHPLTVMFDTIADAIIGNPLNVGIAIGNEEKNANLNCPKWARLLILYGTEKGWNGYSVLSINGSYDLLKEIEKSYSQVKT